VMSTVGAAAVAVVVVAGMTIAARAGGALPAHLPWTAGEEDHSGCTAAAAPVHADRSNAAFRCIRGFRALLLAAQHCWGVLFTGAAASVRPGTVCVMLS
jgi:hypothetical protein